MDWTDIFRQEADDYTEGDTWTVHFDDSIIPDHSEPGWEQYIRNTCGRFICSKCRRSWPSNRVMVVFHMRLNSSTHQGTVKVRRFRQNCKKCSDAPMQSPMIGDENVTILMENLVMNIRRKIYHEDLGYMPRRHVGVNVNNPHEPSHCEGCLAGYCKRNVDALADAVGAFGL